MTTVMGRDVQVGDRLLVAGWEVVKVVAIETGQDTLERTVGDRWYMAGRAVLLDSVTYGERIGWRKLPNDAEYTRDTGLSLNRPSTDPRPTVD